MIQAFAFDDLDAPRPITPKEFDEIRQLAYRTFGLDLKSGKQELVSARLRRLVRSGGFRLISGILSVRPPGSNPRRLKCHG